MESNRGLFYFDRKSLADLAAGLRRDYARAKPFPHVVIDDFLPEDVATRVLDEFPVPTQIKWHDYSASQESKLACEDETQMGEFTRHLISQFNSSLFVSFLEELTGVDALVPDPHLRGGGLHQIRRGGFLKVHADFNWHEKLRLDRRLNLLFYLNRHWADKYGGHLELWNKEMTRCERKVAPLFNRCVIFSTLDHSFHGHPDPLNCPESMTRKSLAFYYYTNGRPPEEASRPHSTLFQRRPGEPGPTAAETMKTVIKECTPPILLDLVRLLKRVSN